MALGKKKKSTSKKKGSSSKKSKSLFRKIGSIWENGDMLSISFDSLDIDAEEPEEYKKGRLLWQDLEADKVYLLKGANVLVHKFDGPSYNISVDLKNSDYHAEEVDMDEE